MVPFGSASRSDHTTIAGHTLDLALTALPPAVANIQEGKLPGRKESGAQRGGLPNCPTCRPWQKPGVPDLESNTLTGIVVPTPAREKDIIERWHREICGSSPCGR